jgi:hypothetical protein
MDDIIIVKPWQSEFRVIAQSIEAMVRAGQHEAPAPPAPTPVASPAPMAKPVAKPVAKPKREKPKSRTQRWQDAVSEARAKFDEAQAALEALQSALGELQSVKEEYEEWKENLPENLASSALGEKLEAIASLDIDTEATDLNDIETVIDEAEGLDLPLGFGRD